MYRPSRAERGFTLIELSIVLVIIGLLVGGVLAGQDLIRAAAVRATISQIEKYNTAVNTFVGKYGALPGDMNAGTAAQFGFTGRGPNPGQGDGNGLIEGYSGYIATGNAGIVEGGGETTLFWQDLSLVNLIESTFNTSNVWGAGPDVTGSGISQYLPQAKLGQNNYIYVYSSGTYTTVWVPSGKNYFGLSAVSDIARNSAYGAAYSAPGLTVQQADSIDTKIDDGFPQTGNVTATYVNFALQNFSPLYAAGPAVGPTGTAATAGSSTTCFDNGSTAGATQQYSVEISGGSNMNCALSFQFQ